ncbi:Nitroreductase-like protein [Stachybotrys elegans]|uniref:Nitroreductase-like protein n=1 Tax=Stachybotrys elegans TaxID=80388 RepID=A0A8K0SJ02_9HYPO|nr:Nitroreductase-like protein [Stachybotrys elegans]
MADTLIKLAEQRRTFYALNKDLPISKERVVEIVKAFTLSTPSSFNSQTTRVLVLFGDEHDKLWDAAGEILKSIVSADQWESTSARINGFKAGAGTVLFFVEQEGVNAMQTAFAAYADKFPGWADQSAGMQQLLTWTAFVAEGLGANLQHYSPLIDQKVADEWKIPAGWKLNAQLVFGGRAGEAGPKEFKPVDERVKVAGL